MRKVFLRTEHMNGALECSWYDKNGRRYKHVVTSFKHQDLTPRKTDDEYVFMAYARQNDFDIVDDYPSTHPKRLT
jgi:hypothetical protein